MRGDRQTAKNLYDSFVGSDNENYKKYAQQLDAKFGFSNMPKTSLATTPGYIYDWTKNSKEISFPDWQKQQGYAIGW